MNRIEDERVRFFLEHEERIREWAALEDEVSKFVHRFYRSLEGDLDAALRVGGIAEYGVMSFRVGRNWPGLGLRREGWPTGKDDPDVRLEWFRKSALFPPRGWLVCGVRTNVEKYRSPFTKEARPAFPRSSSWWPAYRNLDPPRGRYWEGDNLKEYRNYIVETILTAWKDLAPLVDEAVGHSPS
ncbi:MAG: hypothetical protein KTV45_15940 [Acidimicrobiia bacterium]|nr:hypothetical protein [Acidimicrobiia bacterium]